jgi:hypothetical protein
MSARSALWLVAAGLALGTLGCERILEGEIHDPTLPVKQVASRDGIPSEFGDLVGVIPGESPGWALLWFQRPDKSIVAVYVNGAKGILSDHAVEIPRR